MAYDDLISKLRANINNGFSIGMSGRDRIGLADLANLEARLNPGEAESILGSAADDIGFGQGGGDKRTLAALSSLGQGVKFPGFAEGGMIPPEMMMAPPPMEPAPGDDTIISAKTGEYVIPEEVVRFLGIDKLNKLVEGAKAKLAPQKAPGQGYALGGLVEDDPRTKPHTALTNFLKNGQQPVGPTVNTLPNSENITAYTQGSDGFNPIRTSNGVTNWDNQPMSLAQVAELDSQWDSLPVNQGPQQDINTIPLSAGSRTGTLANLADLNRGAIQDRADAGNAMFGLNPATMTPQDQSPLGIQTLGTLKGSINRADSAQESAALRAEIQAQMNNARLQNAMDIARMNQGNRITIQGMKNGTGGQGKAPAGYRWDDDGNLQAIPGGPAAGKNEIRQRQDAGSVASIDQAIESLNDLITHPGKAAATGKSSLLNPVAIPGTDRAGYLTKLDTFKSQMFIPMVSQMKGMGQLSDAEGKKLLDAVGAIDPKMPEKEQMGSMKRILRELNQKRDRLTGGASSPPPVDSRKVTRTGMMNGRKVVQYSDGSVEYGE